MKTELVKVGVIEHIISLSRLVLPVLLGCCGMSRVPALEVRLCVVKGTFSNLLKMTAKYLCQIEESVSTKLEHVLNCSGFAVGVEDNLCKIQGNLTKLNFEYTVD